jgi:peroxiredoxin
VPDASDPTPSPDGAARSRVGQALPNFRKFNATLVAVSPQSPDHALSLTEKHDLKFPVLSDVDQEVARAYRVRFTLSGDLEDLRVNVFQNDPSVQNADGTGSLPVPATFVVDRQGVIQADFVDADWRVRVAREDVEAVLGAGREIDRSPAIAGASRGARVILLAKREANSTKWCGSFANAKATQSRY